MSPDLGKEGEERWSDVSPRKKGGKNEFNVRSIDSQDYKGPGVGQVELDTQTQGELSTLQPPT